MVVYHCFNFVNILRKNYTVKNSKRTCFSDGFLLYEINFKVSHTLQLCREKEDQALEYKVNSNKDKDKNKDREKDKGKEELRQTAAVNSCF